MTEMEKKDKKILVVLIKWVWLDQDGYYMLPFFFSETYYKKDSHILHYLYSIELQIASEKSLQWGLGSETKYHPFSL